MSRLFARVLVALVLVGIVAPGLALGASAGAQAHVTGVHYSAPNGTPTGTPGNNTTNTTNPTGGAPTIAEQTRITPVQFDKSYLRVETREPDAVYNITGPYAVFATNTKVTAARIGQSPAKATVMGDGHTIQVSFDKDAAPPDKTSLYTLELFFKDGSKKTVKLYVSKTDLIVASANLAAASEFIDDMKDDAKEHGFPATIEGIEDYHDWEKKQADLFNNLFGPELEKVWGWIIMTLSSAFVIIGGAIAVALLARRMLKIHGWKIRAHQNTSNLTALKRRELLQAYNAELQAADEERLEDVPEIGSQHMYWSDAFDVYSTKQLADLFAFGQPEVDDTGKIVRDAEGNPMMKHRGIEDLLRADNLRDTWLEPVLRPDMLGSEHSALAQAKRALLRMTTKYGQQQYGDARARSKRLLEELTSGQTIGYGTTSRRRFGTGSGTTGGAD